MTQIADNLAVILSCILIQHGSIEYLISLFIAFKLTYILKHLENNYEKNITLKGLHSPVKLIKLTWHCITCIQNCILVCYSVRKYVVLE